MHARRSHGLSQFVGSIRDESGLRVLDLGEVCQPNVSFLTSLGHRLHSEDFLRTLDSVTHDDEPPGGPSQRDRMEAFLEQTLEFSEGYFHAALIWDTLQYLSRPLLLSTVDRLFEILQPGACLLAFFHTTERPRQVPLYSYRIADAETLHLVPRGHRQPVQLITSRGIEKLFHRFEAVKFFLTRDNLREVILKR